MTTSEPEILYAAEHALATITINRPRVMNAINAPTCLLLIEALERAAVEPGLKALILTGAGGRAFTSGADLSDDRPMSMEATWNRMMLMLARFPRPTIAAIDGVAVGAGFSIALGCDMRIAGEGSRFAAIFARRGLMPDTGATYLIPRLTRPDQALRLLLTGRLVDAAEAERLGLVTELVPQGEAPPRARALAAEIVAAAPLPTLYTRRLLHEPFAVEFEAALAKELVYVEACLETNDAKEGGTAFMEKRAAVWTGT